MKNLTQGFLITLLMKRIVNWLQFPILLPIKNPFTGKVISEKKPIRLTANEIQEIHKQTGKVEVGALPLVWLGVPLKINEKVIGAIVIKDYHDHKKLGPIDVELFCPSLWSSSSGNSPKKVEEKLKRNEEQIKILYKISNAVNTTKNTYDLYHSIYQSVYKIVRTNNFTIGLYDRKRDQWFFPYSNMKFESRYHQK